MIVLIRVKQVKVSVKNDNIEAIYSALVRKLKVNVNDIVNIDIVKKSIDARHTDNVCFVYEIDVKLKDLSKIKFDNDVSISVSNKYSLVLSGDIVLESRPIVVGSGPCGLFCAYFLAKYGFKPIVIERGEDMDNRVKTVSEFWNGGKFNSNSNSEKLSIKKSKATSISSL